MNNNKINFTKTVLEKITPPKKSIDRKGGIYDTYYDTKEKGLILLVSNGGSKTFYLYKKINGKPERVKLGNFPDISIEQARKLALSNKNLINDGRNPNEEKNKIKSEITFKELFDLFMERYSKKHKRSWAYDEREVNKFLNHWFKRKISKITKHEIQLLHEDIGAKNGLYQANRILERIRAIFNKGIEWGLEIPNPAFGIKKFREKSRDRFIQPDELPRFFDALKEEENNTIKDYILISLFTGARKSNVLSMKWEEINFSRNEWRIPETKNGEPLTVPLIKEAIEILIDRKSDAMSDYVFPSEKSSKGFLQDPKKAWKRILTRAQIEDLRIHDLRRTLGSWQAATGANSYIIGKSLGHKTQQATAIYARLSIDPVRESVTRAANAMFAAINK